jgi:rhamnulokinase
VPPRPRQGGGVSLRDGDGVVRVLAIDLGATSVRVASLDLEAPRPALELIHRWHHGPVRDSGGSLRWDWGRIVLEIQRGLEAALRAGPVAAIGVDGWGCDYGLLDRHGALLEPPYSYRDDRTAGWEATSERIGVDRLYGITAIQLMAANTVFQVAAHKRGPLRKAAKLLMLPDLLVRDLTGFEGSELSNASTTALLDSRTRTWSEELLQEVGLSRTVLPEVVAAGSVVGSWQGIPVILVGSHDTASAFVATPGIPAASTAIVSSGTWMLIGVERTAVDTSKPSRDANFSNERAALNGVLFLKNGTGLWILEQCRRRWGNPSVTQLLEAAGEVTEPVPVVDVADPRFFAPEDMEAEIRTAGGFGTDAPRAEIVRSILESIATAAANVIGELGSVVGTPIQEVFVVGGGSRIRLLDDLLGRHTGLPVTVGSPEASALGNALVQGIALGRFRNLDEARQWAALANPEEAAAHQPPQELTKA